MDTIARLFKSTTGQTFHSLLAETVYFSYINLVSILLHTGRSKESTYSRKKTYGSIFKKMKRVVPVSPWKDRQRYPICPNEGPQQTLKEECYCIPNKFQDKQFVKFHADHTVYPSVMHCARVIQKNCTCSSSIVSAINARSFREDIRYSSWLNLPRMLAILGSVVQKLHERAAQEDEEGGRRPRRADGKQMSWAARPCDSFNQSLGCVPPGPELTTSDHATKPASQSSQPYHSDSCQTLVDRTSLPTTPPFLRGTSILTLHDVVGFALNPNKSYESYEAFGISSKYLLLVKNFFIFFLCNFRI